MARWTKNVGSTIGTTGFFDEPSNACWFATQDGRILVFRILGQTVRTLGSGWADAVAVLPSIDGLNVFVVVSSGDVFVASRTQTDRGEASLVASFDSSILGATRLKSDEILILDDAGQVRRLNPSSGASDLVATVPAAAMLAVNESAGELLIAVSGVTAQIRRFKLDDGSVAGTVLNVAPSVAAFAPSQITPGVVICDAAGNVSLHNWSGSVDPFTFNSPGTTSICCWHSLVIAAAGSSLALVEWGDDVKTLPVIAEADPLVSGGWTPLIVDYAAASLTPEDVKWSIDEGPLAATISVAWQPDASGTAYEHRVIAGRGTPEFHITGRQISTSNVVATRRFRVIRIWPDTEVGPPMAVTGPQSVYAKGGWGGGPAGPQNINVHPAPEDFRIAVAVFRVKGASSGIDGAQRVTDLTSDVNGPGRSVKRYYEEVSYRATPASANPAHPKGTTVTLLGGQVFGPIDLDYSWGDLFEHPNPKDLWAAWNPKGDTWDILGGEFSTFLQDRGLADSITKIADSFVLTVLPGTDDPYTVGDKTWPAQWSWAFAGDSQVYWKGPSWTTFSRRASVIMPAALPANHPSPWAADEFMTTICHELGHNLGCPDLYSGGDYPAEIGDRYMTGWDIMDSDSPLPHFSLPHRMRFGWISPDWIEVCDFGKNPASRTVTLQAIETLTRSGPPTGRKTGVEVRIRDGWNYYFELRRKQNAEVGDQKMPFANVILGTDVYQAKADEATRPLIMLLPKDIDNDGPTLRSANKDYKESDVTNPDRMNDFTLTRKLALPFDSNAVNVQIDYIGAHRPELQITPAPGRGNFKSPDISLDGPAGPDVAVKGKVNTIKARVHNRGTKAADTVQIRVQWLPFTSAPGPWNPLPNPPPQAIPALSTREFVVSWSLPASVQVGGTEAEHFCVRVDVDRYVDPTDPAGSEIVVYNNWAQSNFSTDAAAHSSPSERRSTTVSATNIFRRRAMHRTLIEQTSDYFRTFVDHAWRRLAPRQTDVTKLSYESLAGDPLRDRDFQIAFREAQDRGLTNDLTARTFVMPDRIFDGPLERWGIELLVRAGLRTGITRLNARGELVSGTVWAGDAARPQVVNSGNIRLVGWPARRPDQQSSSDGWVDAAGTFRLLVPPSLLWTASRESVLVMVYYHGTPRFAPCHSREVLLRP